MTGAKIAQDLLVGKDFNFIIIYFLQISSFSKPLYKNPHD